MDFLLLGILLGTALAAYLLYLWWSKEDEQPELIIPSSYRKRADTGSDSGVGIPLHIFYGSQTGTAESFAKQLATECKRHGFKGIPFDLEEFEPEKLKDSKLAIFCMATYGEGEPTDNATAFISWIQDEERDVSELSGLQYTVFGLGNRQYEHFNAMGKLVDKRLEEIGAQRVYKRGDGDDDLTLDDDFEEWREELWTSLQDATGAAETGEASVTVNGIALPDLPDIPFNLKYIDRPDESKGEEHAQDPAHADMTTRSYFQAVPAKVLAHRELRQKTLKDGPEYGSTIHVELDSKHPTLSQYQTADNLGILPENDPQIVENLGKWLGFDLDATIALEASDPDGPTPAPLFPVPCTVREAMSHYCDLTAAPRKVYLGYLARYAEKESEKQRLAHLFSKEGKHDFEEWVTACKRSIWEVFEEFSSIRIPLLDFLVITPRLAPRYYTIASSPSMHPNRIHVVVSVVRDPKGSSGRFLEGVCSNFLARTMPPLTDGTGKRLDGSDNGKVRQPWPACRVYVKRSTFVVPRNPSTPVIMVGPGTGIAPMRAILQHRAMEKKQGPIGPTVLFFGCRRRDEDFIYEDELQQYAKDGVLTHMYLAFSREGQKKVYVQHKIQEQGKEVWDLIYNKKGYLYVCGGTKMGEDVHKAIKELAVSEGGMSETEADEYIKQLASKTEGRYIQELWSQWDNALNFLR